MTDQFKKKKKKKNNWPSNWVRRAASPSGSPRRSKCDSRASRGGGGGRAHLEGRLAEFCPNMDTGWGVGEWGAARRQGKGGETGPGSATMAALLLRRRITDALYPLLLVPAQGSTVSLQTFCTLENSLNSSTSSRTDLFFFFFKARSVSHNLFSSLPFTGAGSGFSPCGPVSACCLI